jgi:lysophospholipase L1-like esterase
MNSALHELIKSLNDPEVQLFPLGAIVGQRPGSQAVPDGVHFSAEVHKEIAAALTRDIEAWVRQQRHLQQST